jgi:hypothetical protein
VVDEARTRGCGAVHVTASDVGVALYESAGFAKNDNSRQLAVSAG